SSHFCRVGNETTFGSADSLKHCVRQSLIRTRRSIRMILATEKSPEVDLIWASLEDAARPPFVGALVSIPDILRFPHTQQELLNRQFERDSVLSCRAKQILRFLANDF